MLLWFVCLPPRKPEGWLISFLPVDHSGGKRPAAHSTCSRGGKQAASQADVRGSLCLADCVLLSKPTAFLLTHEPEGCGASVCFSASGQATLSVSCGAGPPEAADERWARQQD